ncbi:hypothetical protein NS115_03780 [Paenibacillus jamilae]|uniref:Uncharacterized protein n=1 Tax=Paenibacillus jamilae TaxID=114136 RepID=A0ACC4ZZK8_9BACL|nr:hypothetical protein [Paenibacillus jamilae]KTS84459.1 hypothetical protein NS115_03780 [Paenibacillus jamilae]
MTSDEKNFKTERVLHLRERLQHMEGKVTEDSAYHCTALLGELVKLEKELAEEAFRAERNKHRRALTFLWGMLIAVTAISIINIALPVIAPQWAKATEWVLAAAYVFYATVSATGAINQFKRGRKWRTLAWMNVGIFVWAMFFAVQALNV